LQSQKFKQHILSHFHGSIIVNLFSCIETTRIIIFMLSNGFIIFKLLVTPVHSLICLRVSNTTTMQMYLSCYTRVLLTTKILDDCLSPIVSGVMACAIILLVACGYATIVLRHIIPPHIYVVFLCVIIVGPLFQNNCLICASQLMIAH
jgi:hypothetical protein